MRFEVMVTSLANCYLLNNKGPTGLLHVAYTIQ